MKLKASRPHDEVEQGLAYDASHSGGGGGGTHAPEGVHCGQIGIRSGGGGSGGDDDDGDFRHNPMAIGFEYVRAMATAATAALGAERLLPTELNTTAAAGVAPGARAAAPTPSNLPCRVLCVGLGAGTLPAFFHHAFSGGSGGGSSSGGGVPLDSVRQVNAAQPISVRQGRGDRHVEVTVVEIERDVADAAERALGLTFNRIDLDDVADDRVGYGVDTPPPLGPSSASERKGGGGSDAGGCKGGGGSGGDGGGSGGFDVVIADASEYLGRLLRLPSAGSTIATGREGFFDCIILDAYDGEVGGDLGPGVER